MTPEQFKRAMEIDSRLKTLARHRIALEKNEPRICVDTGLCAGFGFERLDVPQGVLPKNIRQCCLDAVLTEEAVLKQELAAL